MFEDGEARNVPTTTPGPDLPYTSRAKKVLELAMAEARELKHAYVGTEHLLLGLIREEKGDRRTAPPRRWRRRGQRARRDLTDHRSK